MSTNGSSDYELRLEEVATDWVFERADGFTPERSRAFEVWLAQDSRHAAAVARVEHTLSLLDGLPPHRQRLEQRVATLETQPDGIFADRKRSRRSWAAALGGLAAALAIGFTIFSARDSGQAAELTLATTATQERRVALEDGSALDLNAGTELHVRLDDHERRVELRQGEAHFQVAPDAARPFVVHAGGVAVRAVGTAFNVRLLSGTVEVIVTEGRVAMGARQDIDQPAHGTATDSPAIALVAAGEQARVARTAASARPEVRPVDPVALAQMKAWQEPVVTFVDTPLRDVITRLNRRRAAPIVIEDATLAERRIGGSIALDQVDSFLRLLEQSDEFAIERRASGEILVRRAR